MSVVAVAGGTGAATGGTAAAVSTTAVCAATLGGGGVVLIPCGIVDTGALTVTAAGAAVAAYGAGAYTLSSANSGNIQKAVEGAKASSSVNLGLKLGQDFGSLGKVIANEKGSITLVNDYAKGRALERGLTVGDMEFTVLNPLVRLDQGSGKILYLSERSVVVLDSVGKVVTTYGKADFKTSIMEILSKLVK